MKNIILILLLILSSCGTIRDLRVKRASNKIQKLHIKFPELKKTDTIVKIDSVRYVTERIKHDTINKIIQGDTVTIEKDNVVLKYVYIRDSIITSLEVKGDTVYIPFEVKVPCDKSIVYKDVEVVPWWAYVSLIINLILTGAFISKKYL